VGWWVDVWVCVGVGALVWECERVCERACVLRVGVGVLACG